MPGPPGVFRRRAIPGHLDPGQGIIEVLPFVGSQVNVRRTFPSEKNYDENPLG